MAIIVTVEVFLAMDTCYLKDLLNYIVENYVLDDFNVGIL